MVMSSEPPSHSRPGLVLSAIGTDRAGLVKDLSSYIGRHAGNIEDTRMSRLGGEFALLVLITGKEEDLSRLEHSLSELETTVGLKCFAKRTNAMPEGTKGRSYHLEASGLDRPGIVEKITEVLVARAINVTSFSSRVENAPHSGTPVFLMDAVLEIPMTLNIVQFEKELVQVCEREQLEFILNQD